MLKVTFWHAPEYFAFRAKDPEAKAGLDWLNESDEVVAHGFSARAGYVVVGAISEFTEIPITVEFDRYGPDPIAESSWDRIVECPLAVGSKAIVFESAVGDEFGRLEVPSGLYRLRICYGGQNTRQHSGESEDFYLIQIWPSKDTSTQIIKP